MLIHDYERADFTCKRATEAGAIQVLRERLRKMSDGDLLLFGMTAKYLSSRSTDSGQTSRDEVSVELVEAQAEWKDAVSEVAVEYFTLTATR
jgi:hypothetical protein